MRALHGDEIFGPEALDGIEAFLEPLAAVLGLRPEGLELDVPIADAGAEDEPPAGHDVDRCQLLGNIQGLVKR